MMFKNYFGALLLLLISTVEIRGQLAYTPKSESVERQAICNAARAFVLGKYASAPLPQAIVFKIDRIRIQKGYCNFEAIPLCKDGSYISPKYMADIGFNFCLKKNADRWTVIADLSRTDVPDAVELKSIKRNFPRDFPVSLLSSTWQDLFNKSQ